jgi:hypothetical protein
VLLVARLPALPPPGSERRLSLDGWCGAAQQALLMGKKKPQIAPWLLEV